MADKAKVLLALGQLDPDNAEHWTDDGSPRASAVQTLASDPTIKRSDINSVAPEFTRDTVKAARAAEKTVASTETGGDKNAALAAATADLPEFENEAEARAFLNERISDATHALDDARKGVLEAQGLVRTKEVELQAARSEMQRQFPPLSVSENLKQHLARSAENRAIAAGVGNSKSQIDLAMSRGNSRGWKRPVRSMDTQQANAGTGA